MSFFTMVMRFIITKLRMRQVQKSVLATYAGPSFLGLLSVFTAYKAFKKKPVDLEKRRADAYFPVQSDSERAAKHPLVGAS